MSASRFGKSFAPATDDSQCKSKFFVEFMQNGISGSISAVVNEDIAELKHFYVIEDASDSGLRSVLMERALNYCRSCNIKKVIAVTFPDLKKFFEGKGFNTMEFNGQIVLMVKRID
jgi:N-acetylglutamate synthase-like GNAT family acetyltransferase